MISMATTVPASCDETKSETSAPWWNRRTFMEKIMFIVSGICLLLLACLIMTLAHIGYQSSAIETPENLVHVEPAGICLTPGCVKAAAMILDYMDETVSPCDDFYEFACGGWIQKHPIPDDRSDISVFSVVQDKVDLLIRRMVESPAKGDEPQYILNVKNMYDSCMNASHIEMLSSDPIRNIVRDLGGWPVVEDWEWKLKNFRWMETLLALRRTGLEFNIFFSINVGPDSRNNTRHIIELGQASLGMSDRNHLLKGLEDPNVAAYYQLMVESAVMLGANKATAEREMKEVVKFEMKIANITVSEEELRNSRLLYNKMTLAELYYLVPQVNWERYMSNLLMDKIPRTEEVIVSVPEYVQKMGKLLSGTDKRSHEHKRTIANYLFWRVVQQTFKRLSGPWRDMWHNYNSILTGKFRQELRWKHCLEALDDLGMALASLYVRNHFDESSKDAALELANYIRREFLNIVSTTDWMDERTKERAIEKANNMGSLIGYPDELLDESKLAALYDKLNIHSSNYFENLQIINKWNADEEFSKLRKPYVREDWRERSFSHYVNGFYANVDNSIEIPAGILQGIFFSKDKPNYLNFGSIGLVIGHEVTHGFDDDGSQFDKDGNNVNWWEPETYSKYKEKAQCIIDQYSAYNVTEDGIQLNGFSSQKENIVDNGGIKEAYWAYEQWIKDHGTEDSLPGLKYTPRQLFWISAAHIWCDKTKPEVLKMRIAGSHSPHRFRTIGPFSNRPEFAKAFNCPVGSPMNPVKKCSVW